MTQLAVRTRIARGRIGAGRWELATRAPGARLRPHVHGDYVGYTERTVAPSLRREFAVPFVVALLEFGPPIAVAPDGDLRLRARHHGGFVSGLDDRFAICEHDGFQHGVQVNLTPVGARRLFGMPMSELAGRIVPIADLLPPRHRRLADRLQEIGDWDARFDLLEAVLIECLDATRLDTRVVSWAVRRIHETRGAIGMRALARELGYSQKHVIALFRDQAGIPPKLLARIVRFDRLVRHLRGGGGGRWADLALEFGYYDQAHLTREVRQFAGATPGRVRPLATDPFGLAG